MAWMYTSQILALMLPALVMQMLVAANLSMVLETLLVAVEVVVGIPQNRLHLKLFQ
jgi:hypothetical protein